MRQPPATPSNVPNTATTSSLFMMIGLLPIKAPVPARRSACPAPRPSAAGSGRRAPPQESQGLYVGQGLGQALGQGATGCGQVWYCGPRHRQSQNRHPAAPISSAPRTVNISSLFIPGISHRNGNVPSRSFSPRKLYTRIDDVQMQPTDFPRNAQVDIFPHAASILGYTCGETRQGLPFIAVGPVEATWYVQGREFGVGTAAACGFARRSNPTACGFARCVKRHLLAFRTALRWRSCCSAAPPARPTPRNKSGC